MRDYYITMNSPDTLSLSTSIFFSPEKDTLVIVPTRHRAREVLTELSSNTQLAYSRMTDSVKSLEWNMSIKVVPQDDLLGCLGMSVHTVQISTECTLSMQEMLKLLTKARK